MQIALNSTLNRSAKLGQINPPVEGFGVIFMYLDLENSMGVRNGRTEFTLSDKPNWVRA